MRNKMRMKSVLKREFFLKGEQATSLSRGTMCLREHAACLLHL